MTRLSALFALTAFAWGAGMPGEQVALAQDAASVEVRATHGEFELRSIVDVTSTKIGNGTLVATKYQTICRTPCQISLVPGPVNLWAVEMHDASPELKEKLWLGPGDHKLTIKAGNSRLHAAGLVGVWIGGLTGGIATLVYLRPGSSEQTGPNGQPVEVQNPRSTAALVTATAGLAALLVGGILAVVANPRLSGADEPPRSMSSD